VRAAEVNVTKLQVATAAADAFLTLMAAQETVVAAQAGVDRSRVLNQVIESLVKNELRPGADASRTRAKLALTQTQEIQAEQAREVGRAALAQLLSSDPKTVAIDSARLLEMLPDVEPSAVAATQHPLAIARNAEVAEVKARERALSRSYFPRFDLQSAVFARGTGIQGDGRTGARRLGSDQTFKTGLSVRRSIFRPLTGFLFTPGNRFPWPGGMNTLSRRVSL
jgi:outer membrane protein